MKVLAADVGGTTIKLGIVENGHVLAYRRIPAMSDQSMESRLDAIAVGWNALLAENDTQIEQCAGVGLALPFLIDAGGRRVLGEFGKFPGATQIDFVEWSKARFNLQLAMENDLRVALLGECSAGVAKGQSDVAMIALGTGIGFAVMCGGALLRGSHNRAATLFGHSTVRFDGAAARCGNLGCAEDFASTAALDEIARSRPGYAASKLAGMAALDFETVFHLADAGDTCAKEVIAQSLRVWAAVCLNAVIAYDPAIVVIGGGLMARADIITSTIQQHIATHTPGLRWTVPVVPAALGDRAALVGCETLFKQRYLGGSS